MTVSCGGAWAAHSRGSANRTASAHSERCMIISNEDVALSLPREESNSVPVFGAPRRIVASPLPSRGARGLRLIGGVVQRHGECPKRSIRGQEVVDRLGPRQIAFRRHGAIAKDVQ